MISVKAKLEGRLFGNWQRAYREEFGFAMKKSVVEMTTAIKNETPVGVSGHLRQGIRGEVLAFNHGVIATTGSGSKYGEIVERGRRPGPVSKAGQENIERWVRRKIRPHVLAVNRTTRRITKQVTTKGKRGGNPRERIIKQVAFLVTRKIREKGFKGKFMFQKAEDRLKPRINSLFEAAKRSVESLFSDK